MMSLARTISILYQGAQVEEAECEEILQTVTTLDSKVLQSLVEACGYNSPLVKLLVERVDFNLLSQEQWYVLTDWASEADKVEAILSNKTLGTEQWFSVAKSVIAKPRVFKWLWPQLKAHGAAQIELLGKCSGVVGPMAEALIGTEDCEVICNEVIRGALIKELGGFLVKGRQRNAYELAGILQNLGGIPGWQTSWSEKVVTTLVQRILVGEFEGESSRRAIRIMSMLEREELLPWVSSQTAARVISAAGLEGRSHVMGFVSALGKHRLEAAAPERVI